MDENGTITELIGIDALERILGRERMEVLAEQALKEALDWAFRRDRQAVENLIYRVAYRSALSYIAEEHGVEMREKCVEAIQKTLEKENMAYYMFSDNPAGKQILNEEIDKARPYIQESLHKSIDQYTLRIDRADLEDMIWEHIVSKILGDKVSGSEAMDHEDASEK